MIENVLSFLHHAGSRYHEEDDAESFADWGVDFLKYDNCWAPASDWVIDRYTAMHAALNGTGRPILYSMCDWGVGDPWLWAPKVQLLCNSACMSNPPKLEKIAEADLPVQIANSWRTTGDISPSWESMLRCLDNTIGLSEFAKPVCSSAFLTNASLNCLSSADDFRSSEA